MTQPASKRLVTEASFPGIGAPLFAPSSRQFVVFGDSWTTDLDGVNIPATAIASLGGTLVKNHGVAGAILGPTSQNSGNATDAQVTTAQADTSYNKSRVTDVLVLIGVNNIGGYLPTVTQASDHFNAIQALYPNAQLWYAANSKRAINNAGDNDPWRWYNRFFEGASLAGVNTAPFSPMWHWGVNRASYWDPANPSGEGSRHMIAAGQNAWAQRLAAFLSGNDGWRPFFKVPMALHANAAALMTAQAVAGTPTIATDDSYIHGDTLRLHVSITGMDTLSAVATTAWQALLQIPTAYAPIGNYLHYPTGCRLSGGTMDHNYSMRVQPAGVVEVDPRLLNNHVAYFVLNADIPLTVIKTAD